MWLLTLKKCSQNTIVILGSRLRLFILSKQFYASIYKHVKDFNLANLNFYSINTSENN